MLPDDTPPLLSFSTELLIAFFNWMTSATSRNADWSVCLQPGSDYPLTVTTQVCRLFNEIFRTPALGYNRLLGYAGMIDTVPNAREPDISARANSLAAYLQAWREKQLSFDCHITDSYCGKDCVVDPSSGAVISLLDRTTHRQLFFLPASTIRRAVEARKWTLGVEHVPDGIDLCQIDYGQDLVVIVTRPQNSK